MARTFQLDIRTPEGVAYQGSVEAVSLPGTAGPFQVLINHAALMTDLEVGDIKILNEEGKEEHFASSGGFAEVRNNVVTVLSETIERAENIDVDRAKKSAERAQGRIQQARTEPESGVDQLRAEAALARAQNRLQIVSRL